MEIDDVYLFVFFIFFTINNKIIKVQDPLAMLDELYNEVKKRL